MKCDGPSKPILEELDFQPTPLGDISLRRRSEPRLDGLLIYEVKLGDEFLMSSLFVEGEVQLSRLALATQDGSELDVVVGGLGLGYTAAAALETGRVASLTVIDVMQPVIDWHQRELVPLGATLSSDDRVTLHYGDFFAMALAAEPGFIPGQSGKQVHAVLLDIDHSPGHWLNAANNVFYSVQGLTGVLKKLLPGGVFGLWSNDPPDPVFTELLESVFAAATSHVVEFSNPYTGATSSNTVYLGLKADGE